MRLTRRGWSALAVAAAGYGLGAVAGARALDALVVPVLVALGAAVVQVGRADAPAVERTEPAPGFPGERRTVELSVETPLACDAVEESGDGLAVVDGDRALAAGGTYEYEVELRARGEHRLGPTRVTVRDALGLVRRTHATTGTTRVLVYPALRAIDDRRAFAGLVERAGAPDRKAFDRLREYTESDPLRDVNWKASARRPADDLVVTEYAAEDEGGVTLTAEAATGHADEMATAAASVATYLLDAELLVGAVAPGGRLGEARGDHQRRRVLELFARTPAGRVGRSHRDDADVRVEADEDGVTVRVRGRAHRFEDLAAEHRADGPGGPEPGGRDGRRGPRPRPEEAVP